MSGRWTSFDICSTPAATTFGLQWPTERERGGGRGKERYREGKGREGGKEGGREREQEIRVNPSFVAEIAAIQGV